MKTTVKLMIAETLIALLFLVVNTNAEATETKASSHEIFETELQLEDWMLVEGMWNSNTFNIADFTEETESNLELEDWMTNDSMWNLNIVVETDSELVLADWMTNDETWEVDNLNIEPELRLENWMMDSNIRE